MSYYNEKINEIEVMNKEDEKEKVEKRLKAYKDLLLEKKESEVDK